MSGDDRESRAKAKRLILERVLVRAKIVGPVVGVMMIAAAAVLPIAEAEVGDSSAGLTPATKLADLPSSDPRLNSMNTGLDGTPSRDEAALGGCEQVAFQLMDGATPQAVHCTIRSQDYARCGDLDEITANRGRFLPSSEFQGQCQFDPRS